MNKIISRILFVVSLGFLSAACWVGEYGNGWPYVGQAAIIFWLGWEVHGNFGDKK